MTRGGSKIVEILSQKRGFVAKPKSIFFNRLNCAGEKCLGTLLTGWLFFSMVMILRMKTHGNIVILIARLPVVGRVAGVLLIAVRRAGS